jgi:hypothetical protein
VIPESDTQLPGFSVLAQVDRHSNAGLSDTSDCPVSGALARRWGTLAAPDQNQGCYAQGQQYRYES